MVADYIERIGLNAPTEIDRQLRDGYEQKEFDTLDLRAPGIRIVGHWLDFDFSLVKLPVTDEAAIRFRVAA